MRTSPLLAALALAACATAKPAPAPTEPVQFIEDDYPRALAEAKASHKPLFVDAWAPW